MDENLYFDGWKAGLGEFVEGRGGEWSVAQCTSGGGSCENYCFLGKMLYRKQELEVEQVAYCPGVLSNDPIGVG